MTPIWRRHLIVCFGLALLAVPIYFLDQALFAPTGSNWITLDFRGLLFWSYLAWVAIYMVLSSLALAIFPARRTFGFQLGLMALSLILLVGGFIAYGGTLRRTSDKLYRDLMERRRALLGVIELKEWQYYPDEISPEEIRVKVAVHDSGRFAGNATGEQTDPSGSATTVFESINEPRDQRQVSKGESFTYVFPLKILHNGRADNVRITLYLFKAASGPTTGDITKVFINSPQQDDDGEDFYGVLPPPSRPAK